jgi:Tol biopolymer transport system component/predicted Ser/Thr protein kinase
MIGRMLGQYRVDARLGAGGMGVVYRAYDVRLQRTVALKVVNRQPAIPLADDHVIEEARAASALNHPNICTVYEVGEVDGEAFIAMEYVAGRPLAQIIPQGGLPYEDVLRYASDIAGALAHAHDNGVVHRDLKSANVVLTSDGRAKVLDFGIARRVDVAPNADTSSGRHDPQGAFPGTTSYMAPEVLLGEPADARSDIWSLGVLIFELAAGEMPFTGRNQFDITSGIIRAAPAPLPPHVPVSLRGIVLRCLTKDPLQRYQRAGEARAALEAIKSDVAVAPYGRPRERRWVPAALTAGAIAAAALIAWGAWKFWPSPPTLADRLTRGATLSPVLSSVRPASDPSLSLDGKMVTFAAEDEQGQVDVYVARVAGGARIRVTNDPDAESGPRFSADGERLAFGARRQNGPPEVRVVPALGGDAIATITNAASPAWAGDGRLAYLRQAASGNMELVVSRIDGGEARTILAGDAAFPFLRSPSWSPEADEIAVVRSTGGVAGEIWLVPLSGAAPRVLVDDPPTVYSHWPSYTPDGTAILYASNRGGTTNIWLHPRDGGTPVKLTTGPGADETPSIASDGTIAFVNSRWKNVLEAYAFPGGAPKILASHMPFIWAPAVDPSGREIAFSRSEVDGAWHVWTVPIDGGTPRRLTDSAAGELYPRYTPDGSRILFHTWNAPRRVGAVPRAGGSVQMLPFGADTSDAFADVSPDGRLVVFTRSEADAERLYMAPAAGGQARLLTRTPGAVARWSPDGTRLAFGGTRGFTGGVFVIGADGRNERRLTADGGWPVWWPGKGIAYLAPTAGGSPQIRVVGEEGGTPASLERVKLLGNNHPFDISRTGNLLVVSNGVHVSDEIWLLEPRK